MHLTILQYGLAAGTGSLIGFLLGLVGGGGSILAVPLLVYVVGIRDPHLAIGTSALAVAVNAGITLISHARGGAIKWCCANLFACAGVAGALVGSAAGKAVHGQKLLNLFALLMCVVGVLMVRRRSVEGDAAVTLDRKNGARLALLGGATGTLCGFFGIGGGFLIVPGLIASTGMPVIQAVGSSLVAVTAFGATTALSYAWAGWVDWTLAAMIVAGGVVGGIIGAALSVRLAARKGALNTVVATLILAVAGYMLVT